MESGTNCKCPALDSRASGFLCAAFHKSWKWWLHEWREDLCPECLWAEYSALLVHSETKPTGQVDQTPLLHHSFTQTKQEGGGGGFIRSVIAVMNLSRWTTALTLAANEAAVIPWQPGQTRCSNSVWWRGVHSVHSDWGCRFTPPPALLLHMSSLLKVCKVFRNHGPFTLWLPTVTAAAGVLTSTRREGDNCRSQRRRQSCLQVSTTCCEDLSVTQADQNF